MVDFTAKQSAFVSQTTLFGYIKTRAGTSWPKLFEDDTYLVSLRAPPDHISLPPRVSDLSLFFAARMFRDGQFSAEQAEELAVRIAQQVLITPDIDKHEDIDPDAFQDVVNRTRQRASVMPWAEAATSALAFQSSSDAFMRWAPVTDEFKASDEEIMRNRFICAGLAFAAILRKHCM